MGGGGGQINWVAESCLAGLQGRGLIASIYKGIGV